MSGPTFANYELEALIGRGGMAEVYRAKALKGAHEGRTVALKRLLPALAQNPAYVDLFTGEADITRQLKHPAIVEVLETGVVGETYYIAMDYVEGRNLRQVLSQCVARSIVLPIDFGAYVVHTIAQALEYAHHALNAAGQPLGIVHRDVSPSNVFISRDGEIKLGDFGVAQADVIGDELPEKGPFGKVHYLSPEQLTGRDTTPATDIFALGAILFELLTNRRAFPGEVAREVGQRVLAGWIEPPSQLRPEVKPALDAVVLRALSVVPEARYPSAAMFGADLAKNYNPAIGEPLAIAAVVRGLFGSEA
jgi:eukaryotic-like serine/threonine-protein kinase